LAKCAAHNARHLTKCATFGKLRVRLGAFGQTRAELTNCAARLPKCAAHLVNPTNSDQMQTQFFKCASIWPIADWGAHLAKYFQNKTTYARPLFIKRTLNENVYQVVSVNALKF